MTDNNADKPRILFVDDEAFILKSYKRSLLMHRKTWDMEFESCPVEALRRARETPYDAIVSDVRMPRMNGIELLQELKSDQRTQDVPVIIVTGEADKGLKRKALSLDAADLLNKPVSVEDLIARLRSVL